MRSFGTATVAVLLWLAVALAIDRWLLAPYCATCASALALDLKVRLPAAELTYPPVSVLVLIVLPMLLLAFFWCRGGTCARLLRGGSLSYTGASLGSGCSLQSCWPLLGKASMLR